MSVQPVTSEKDPQTYAIIGAAMEVHRQLGPGFLESVYQEALGLECASRDIPFTREALLTIFYKGKPLATKFRPDFICFQDLIVELKAMTTKLGGIEQSQLLNYLKATGYHRGLLLNFGLPSLKHERFVWGPPPGDNPTHIQSV